MAVPVNPKYPLFLRNIGKGGNIGGYPIVTIEDGATIEAKPNTFYDIKNPINVEISIICDPLELAPTKIYFDYDGSTTDGSGGLFLMAGLNLLPDNTKKGYNYKALINTSTINNSVIDVVEIYFTNDIIQGGNTVAYANILGNEIEIVINNINIIKPKNVIGEFVFNVNCPCSIQFGNIFNWNNDDVPDLTQEGICTISIVNGVACYTFVKS